MIRVLAAVAAIVAARNVVDWLVTAASGIPVGYGEGAVVHAGQILAHGGDPYALDPSRFVSANYPPLGYVVVALGLPLGPFMGLRVANILAAAAVAALVAWRARAGGALAIVLGASFLALYPVGAWTPGDRVDLLAVAFTAFAITSLRAPRGAIAFGVLGALALASKPTAIVPLTCVLGYLVGADRPLALRAGGSLAVAATLAVAAASARFDGAGMYEHLVVFNAFPYDAASALLLLVVGGLLLGGFAVLAFRVGDGLSRAYLVGALGVVALGGHEGATINYVIDLVAAACLGLASAKRPWPSWAAPVLAGQLLATLAVTTLGGFAPAPLDTLAARLDVVRDLPPDGLYYAEDSGLLVAVGIEPVVDDTFVWARLVALGVRADDVTPRVAARSFHAIISDVPLDRLAAASALERLRWPAQLVDAVLANYEIDRAVPGAYRYVPRRGFALH